MVEVGVVLKISRALRTQVSHNPTIRKFLDPPLVCVCVCVGVGVNVSIYSEI